MKGGVCTVSGGHCWRLRESQEQVGVGKGAFCRVMGGHGKVQVSRDSHVLGVTGYGEGELWQVPYWMIARRELGWGSV